MSQHYFMADRLSPYLPRYALPPLQPRKGQIAVQDIFGTTSFKSTSDAHISNLVWASQGLRYHPGAPGPPQVGCFPSGHPKRRLTWKGTMKWKSGAGEKAQWLTAVNALPEIHRSLACSLGKGYEAWAPKMLSAILVKTQQ